jgi:hypothetical protein
MDTETKPFGFGSNTRRVYEIVRKDVAYMNRTNNYLSQFGSIGIDLSLTLIGKEELNKRIEDPNCHFASEDLIDNASQEELKKAEQTLIDQIKIFGRVFSQRPVIGCKGIAGVSIILKYTDDLGRTLPFEISYYHTFSYDENDIPTTKKTFNVGTCPYTDNFIEDNYEKFKKIICKIVDGKVYDEKKDISRRENKTTGETEITGDCNFNIEMNDFGMDDVFDHLTLYKKYFDDVFLGGAMFSHAHKSEYEDTGIDKNLWKFENYKNLENFKKELVYIDPDIDDISTAKEKETNLKGLTDEDCLRLDAYIKQTKAEIKTKSGETK